MDTKTIVAAAGGPTKVARQLNISTAAVCQWRRVPAGRVLAVEHLTGIPRHVIRPDIYPPPETEVAA